MKTTYFIGIATILSITSLALSGCTNEEDTDKIVDSSTTAAPSSISSTSSTATIESSVAQETILTEQTNADFAHILQTSDDFEAYRNFATNHKDQTIEFDGNIASIANHEGYSTRYDILIYAGDYSATSATGASFQLKNVSPTTINFTGDNQPDSLQEGQNIHIVATVVDYNDGGDLIIIEPTTISMR
ncbi:DUF4839 domain-containing protein [Enterococcus sp. AZ109]|uniref:DUF4839 domain-containing protein n=1 Tax=Enterococcus sp. AZ109 TaxID=2774634 RepID=UPI003F210E73